MKRQILFPMTLMVFLAMARESQAQLDTSKVREAIKKVNLAYLKMYPMKSQVTYSYYSDYSGKPDQSVVYTIYSDTGFQCMVSEEIESYEYDSLRVFINHKEKMVSVEKRLKEPFDFTHLFQLDSLWHMVEKVTIQEQGKEQVHTMTLRKALYSKIVFRVNKSTGIMSSMQLYASPEADPGLAKAMLQVSISGVQKNTRFVPAYSVSQKIKVDASGKVTLIGALKGYQLLTPLIG